MEKRKRKKKMRRKKRASQVVVVTVQLKISLEKFFLESFLLPTFLGVFGMLDRRDVSISLFLIRLKRFVEVELQILTPHVALSSLFYGVAVSHGETNFVRQNNST